MSLVWCRALLCCCKSRKDRSSDGSKNMIFEYEQNSERSGPYAPGGNGKKEKGSDDEVSHASVASSVGVSSLYVPLL